MDHNTTVIVMTALVMGSGMIVGVTAIVTRAWLKVAHGGAELKAEARGTNKETVEAIEQLRKEVAQLRDTTTRYDLAFDTALQRLESRISHMESRTSAQEEPAPA